MSRSRRRDRLHRAAREPDSVLPGCELLPRFLTQRGQKEEARRYRQRASRHEELLELAHRERSRRVTTKDTLLPHGLTAERLARLAAQLEGATQVRAAYLVRKAVIPLPEKPLFILGIVLHRRWYRLTKEARDMTLLDALVAEADLPGQVMAIPLNADRRWLRFLERLPDARICGR